MLQSKDVSCERLDKDAGMLPVSFSLSAKSRCASSVRLDKDDGMLPVNELMKKLKKVRRVRLEMEDGMLPVINPFQARFKYSS